VIAITSFSKTGYELYGKNFLESFVKFWPCKVIVYYESLPDFQHEKVEYKNLFDLVDLKNFLTIGPRLVGEHAFKGDLEGGYNYNFDAWKFCRKSFVQFDALKNHQGKVLWLDADTVTRKKVTKGWIDGIYSDAGLVVLDRAGFHCESGFVGFDTEAPGFGDFLAKYIEVYRKGVLFTLERWHDCAAIDWARAFKLVKEKNLSPFWKAGDDLSVWDKSVLQEVMTHNKGARKYGVEKVWK
jgi:hypothetical protein